MNARLEHDQKHLAEVLTQTLEDAQTFLASLEDRKVAQMPEPRDYLNLPYNGLGAQNALELFKDRYAAQLSASAGARYFGFVTGGATPAALAGDWLTSSIDNSATGYGDSVVPLIELETIAMLRDLFGLASEFSGVFVTGATMSNFTGLAMARQWVGKQQGQNVAQDG